MNDEMRPRGGEASEFDSLRTCPGKPLFSVLAREPVMMEVRREVEVAGKHDRLVRPCQLE